MQVSPGGQMVNQPNVLKQSEVRKRLYLSQLPLCFNAFKLSRGMIIHKNTQNKTVLRIEN